jgi:DNA-binding NtrC family response regulator
MLKFVGDRVLERTPLRARPREVERLVTRTLQQAATRFARPPVRVSADGMKYLKGLPLRGNHAELEAVLLGACFAVEGTLLTAAALVRSATVAEAPPDDSAGPSSV